jgi:hypothetical protein
MIDYQTFLSSEIDPTYGLSEFVLNSEIFKFYEYLNPRELEYLEREYLDKAMPYYQLNIWNALILIFDRQKLLKYIIIKDNHIAFERYYIGMEFDEAMKLPTSVYNINGDEDSIYHSSHKRIKFNLDIGFNNKLFISSIEVFDFTHKEKYSSDNADL